MISIAPDIVLDEKELVFSFIRASGPGGQNVNKVATAAQLRFDAKASPSLPPHVQRRLLGLAGKRATDAGLIIIEARRYRTQEQNRLDAVDRLVRLIAAAARPPKPRKKTKPSKAARQRRMNEKRQRGETKKMRAAIAGYRD